MSFIVDFSFAHAAVTKALTAHRLGPDCIGGIAYAGCADPAKNITRPELHDLLNARYQMALTIENVATDLIGGAPVGAAHGKAVLAAAKDLGYDWQNCVLNTGYDTDSHEADWPKLLAAMEAFADSVPVPGFYGDSDAIDFLHARHPDWFFWQSESGSFSPKKPTPNAHLWQRFNDPRAKGLGVDVNNILRTPLRFMGEDMPLSATDAELVVDHLMHRVIVTDGKVTVADALRQIRVQSDPAKIAAAVAAKLPAGTANTAAIEAALRAVFADAGKA